MTTPNSAPTERLDEDVRRQALFAAHPSLVHLGARYEVRREIGSGGMGYVFEARDRETGEVLALKVLRPEIATDPAMAERFKNELRLARRITHKNVCRIYDFNRIESLAYISMEYVDGVTLRAHLDRTGVLPFARVVSLARQIGAGLSEAHAQGIIHRDLKPENVMLTASGAVKLMDFGIARMVHPVSTATQTLIGTPAYMSPEQAQGRGVDARSDIYALGLILYECLTARRAFAAPTPVAVALKQIQERPTPPHSARPDIPRALEAAVLRCMEKEPARRFASIDELSRALARSIMSDPTPVSVPRRWPWLVAAGAVLSVGAVAWNRSANVHTPPAAVPATAATTSPAPKAISPPAVPARAPEPVAESRAQIPNERVENLRERRASFEQIKSEAEAGNSQAQFRLGMLLATGPAAIRDESQARQWIERSAQQGYAEAQFSLGAMYEKGRGVERDRRSAIAWYRRAAQAGHEGAQRNLARLEQGARRLP